MIKRTCLYCNGYIAPYKRIDTLYCQAHCRILAHRQNALEVKISVNTDGGVF